MYARTNKILKCLCSAMSTTTKKFCKNRRQVGPDQTLQETKFITIKIKLIWQIRMRMNNSINTGRLIMRESKGKSNLVFKQRQQWLELSRNQPTFSSKCKQRNLINKEQKQLSSRSRYGSFNAVHW